jgi:hypothetical protein
MHEAATAIDLRTSYFDTGSILAAIAELFAGFYFGGVDQIEDVLTEDQNAAHSRRLAYSKVARGNQPLDRTQTDVQYFGGFFT